MTRWFDTPRTSDRLRLLRTAAFRLAGLLVDSAASVRQRPEAFLRDRADCFPVAIVWMSPGFFPGAERPSGQDIRVLGH